MCGADDAEKQRRRARWEASEARYRRAVLVATGKTLPVSPSPQLQLQERIRRARALVSRRMQ